MIQLMYRLSVAMICHIVQRISILGKNQINAQCVVPSDKLLSMKYSYLVVSMSLLRSQKSDTEQSCGTKAFAT